MRIVGKLLRRPNKKKKDKGDFNFDRGALWNLRERAIREGRKIWIYFSMSGNHPDRRFQ